MKKRLISIDVSLGKYSSFVDNIIQLAETSKPAYVCIANVHMLVEAYKDPEFAEIVNKADLTTPDGVPLAWGIKLLYNIRQDRVAGMDLLPDLLKQSEILKIPVFFYGSTEDTLNKTSKFIINKYPNLPIAGMYSPPFRPLSAQEDLDVNDIIKASGARLLFVVLGCPKQEKWMYRKFSSLNVTMVGVGGALPVMIGDQKRAPLWMQKYGLEWLYRFKQEPKRLFKRYFETNTYFILLLLKAFLKNRLFGKF